MYHAQIKPIHIAHDGSITAEKTPEEREFLQGWQPSSVATSKDIQESKRVAKAINAVPKQCWFNARRAILKLDDYAEASLVEGWALCGDGLSIEHGWIVRNGIIIDPTLPEKTIMYFPGLEFRGRAGGQELFGVSTGQEVQEKSLLLRLWMGWHE